MTEETNPFANFIKTLYYIMDTPVTIFREKIVEPNQKKYPWYHQQFRRVPTIDECYTDDAVCIYEANLQYKRDRLVDEQILQILRIRYEDCIVYHGIQEIEPCEHLLKAYHDASGHWFAKHGDIGPVPDVREAFMKQKHRMIWERRHGPVGTGMKE